jgi:hypothetical protein
MSGTQKLPDDQPLDLSAVAGEPPDESTQAEQDPVGGDQPDTGDTVPPDNAQSPPTAR